jgi:hypothetical protein
MKGEPAAEELRRGAEVAKMVGMTPRAEDRFTLPGGEHRTILTSERTGRERVRLPRRPGMAQRQPLA